ncbi:phage head closure protein [Consotaella aegiceratis]|uniref:phage head closure protein n=1 Tax=Consotaella aegiceratis TaxID=3097961 RepID=UPI002F403AF2
MGTLFLDPGLLGKRARVLRMDLVPDGMGGGAPSWSEVAEVSVHVEPVSVASREVFGQREATVTHRVTCRFRNDIDRGMTFALGDRWLTILSIHDPDESSRYLVCRCEEET